MTAKEYFLPFLPFDRYQIAKSLCEECFQMDIFQKDRHMDKIYPRYCLVYFLISNKLITPAQLGNLLPFDRSVIYNIMFRVNNYLKTDDNIFCAYWERFMAFLDAYVEEREMINLNL